MFKLRKTNSEIPRIIQTVDQYGLTIRLINISLFRFDNEKKFMNMLNGETYYYQYLGLSLRSFHKPLFSNNKRS